MRVSINSRSLFAALALSTIALAPLHARPVVAAETTLVAKAELPTSSARWVGVYRITLSGAKDGAMVDARVLIEPNGQNLMGMLMVDQHASGITDVKVENEALVARVVTAEGKGTLTLRTTDEGIVGDLKIGKRTWQVSGARAI